MGGMQRWRKELRDRTAEIRDLRQLIAADDTPPAQRIKYRARLRVLESERDAACADRRQRDAKRESVKVKAANESRQAEIDRQHAIQQAQQSAETARQNAISKKESDRLAAIAKVEQDRIDAMPRAWWIANYSHYVDERGMDIPKSNLSKYHICGQTDLHRALQVQNSGGALVLSKRLEPYFLHT
jgi:hypothetical protein